MTLLSTALLLTALAPTVESKAQNEAIESLARDLEAAEGSFEASVQDLYNLDVCKSAADLDWDLRRVERSAMELEASALSHDARALLLTRVFDQLDYARYRLRQVEGVGIGAQELADALLRMRAARMGGRPGAAIWIHREMVGLRGHGEETPFLLRRLSSALDVERRRAAAGGAEPLAEPR